jgi:TonB family protein
MRFFAALLIFSVIGALPCAKAQQSPFDAVASDAAAAIAKASRKHPDATVLVADFSEGKGHPTVLGSDLAEQFFLSLRTHAQNFGFADRDRYLHQLAADKLSPESYQSPDNMKCYASELAAEFIVTGELEDSSGNVVVGIKVTRMDGHKAIFDRQISLDLTPGMRELLEKEPPALAPSNSTRSATDIQTRARVPGAGAKGYSMPSCVYCPNPRFSDAAVKEKRQGTVLMTVRIGADGLVEDVSVLRGLACGFNRQAMDAVRSWRFRPATGPDGQPAEVTTTVEVTFRLY